MATPRTLVAFYSLTNNTRKTAQALAERMGADLEEIVPSRVPRSIFLTAILGTFASMRKRDWPTQPARHPMAGYDLVIVGGPIWVGALAPPVRGWLKANPLSPSARLAAFATAHGGVQDKAFREMAEIARRPMQATLIVSDQDRRQGREAERVSAFAQMLAGAP